MVKPVAFALFVSCCVSAFCLAMLAYTLGTGELPFGLQPILSEKLDLPVERPSEPVDEMSATRARINEATLREFYNQMVRERENLAADREELAHERAVVEEIRTQARKMQAEIEVQEKKLNELLIKIEEDQKQGLERLANLMSGMDIAESIELLMGMNDDMATRVLHSMNRKLVAQIISQVMRSPDPERVERIKRIAKDLQRISDR